MTSHQSAQCLSELREVDSAQFCNRVQPRGGPKQGFAMGSITQGVQEIPEKNIYDALTPTSPSWGMGHREQGHSELFWLATALQLTPGMVI